VDQGFGGTVYLSLKARTTRKMAVAGFVEKNCLPAIIIIIIIIIIIM
jgi:hypothetical protein